MTPAARRFRNAAILSGCLLVWCLIGGSLWAGFFSEFGGGR